VQTVFLRTLSVFVLHRDLEEAGARGWARRHIPTLRGVTQQARNLAVEERLAGIGLLLRTATRSSHVCSTK
jgi:hypothetical protein